MERWAHALRRQQRKHIAEHVPPSPSQAAAPGRCDPCAPVQLAPPILIYIVAGGGQSHAKLGTEGIPERSLVAPHSVIRGSPHSGARLFP